MSDSGYEEIKSILKDSALTVNRRIYFLRRESDGNYESDWQEIESSRIIQYGKITRSTSGKRITCVETGSLNITLDNQDGYFDIDYVDSFFYGYYSTYRTLVKIEVAYLEKDGTEQPINPVVFVGYIGDDQQITSDGYIKFQIFPMEDLAKKFPMKSIRNFPTYDKRNSKRDLENIYDNSSDYSGTSSSIWQNMFSVGALKGWNSDRGNITIPSTFSNTNTVGDESTWEYMKKISDLENKQLHITRDAYLSYRLGEHDNFYRDQVVDSAPSDCIYHHPLEDYSTPTIGPTLTLAGGSVSTSPVKHNNGISVDKTTTSYLYVNSLTGFDPNNFTVQFWLKPGFGSGVFGTLGASGPLIEITPKSFYSGGTAVNDEIIFGSFTNGSGNYFFALNKYRAGYTAASITEISETSAYCNTTTFNGFVKDDVQFFAIVHNSKGINRQTSTGYDTTRIYQLNTSGTEMVLIGRAKHTSVSDYGHTVDIGSGNYTTPMTMTILKGLNSAYNTYIDDLKIFNYCKLEFDDRDFENKYTRKEKYEFHGRGENIDKNFGVNILGDIKINKKLANVANHVTITYGSSSSQYVLKENLAFSQSQSSDMFGVRKYEVKNQFIGLVEAINYAQEIFSELSFPKKEISFKSKLMPYINIGEKTRLTYQTSLIFRNGFSSGFDNGFGPAHRVIDFNEAKFKIIKTDHDLDRLESNITLREE